MNIVLFDAKSIRQNLLPLTYTRPVGAIRCGIFTIQEKWESWFPANVSFLTQKLLADFYPIVLADENYWINGATLPNDAFLQAILALELNQALVKNGHVLCVYTREKMTCDQLEIENLPSNVKHLELEDDLVVIEQSWQIFLENGVQIEKDFNIIRNKRKTGIIKDKHTIVYSDLTHHVFAEEDADIKAAILDARKGSIYIGKGAVICPGAIIEGPASIGEKSVVNFGAKIRKNTTVGPSCKVGGEINNAVFFGFSNKGHDGFMGNAVIGEWVNWGADTNNSNMKNNYSTVKMYHIASEKLVDTGQHFCGIVMADHAKAGINSMFNTGTTVGVGANIFGSVFPPKYIPSFVWGGQQEESQEYRLEKFLESAEIAMKRRNVNFDWSHRLLYTTIFEETEKDRIKFIAS